VRRYIAVRARDQSQENTMYAVVTTGGKQYRVEAGNELTIERLAADAGTSVTFDRVLLVGDGETVTVGTPVVDGATVSATVLGESLGPKLVIFKFKQKVKYRRTTGHRQHMTRVRIDEISAAGKTSKAERPSRTTAPKVEAEAGKAEATEAPKPRRTRAAATAKTATAKTATAKTATAKAPAAKRTATKRAAAKSEASDTQATSETAPEAEAAKPKRTRKPATSKAKATPEPETEE
jgi:large subunit ribosomal protein L21